MKETIDKNPSQFATVDYHDATELEGAKCLLGSGGNGETSGYFGSVVKPNGDITGVFSSVRGVGGKESILCAIKNGGDRLDAYAYDNEADAPGYLAHFYAKSGFEPVARVPFNAEYAAPGMQPQDIVFYKHNGDSADKVAANYGKYPKPTKEQYDALPVMDYDAAMKYRDSLVDLTKTTKSITHILPLKEV
jgi:hypothetical protein